MHPGAALHFFLLTLIVTAIVSPLVMWRYGAAVLGGMRSAAGAELGLRAPGVALAAAQATAAQRLVWERGAQRRTQAAWLIAVALAALPLAGVYIGASELPRTPLHLAMVLGTMLVVAVPPMAVALGWSLAQGVARAVLLSVAVAVVTLALSIGQRIARGGAPSLDQALNLFSFYAFAGLMLATPLLVFAVSSTPRVRGVVPMTFGALMVFAGAPILASGLWTGLGATESGTQAMLGSGWLASRHALLLIVALPFGALAAWRLSALASAYAAKRFSDVQLLARVWWLMFVVLIAIELLNSRTGGVAWAVAAAACVLPFAALQRVVFARVGVARAAPPPATLLLLRVFGFRSRTEALFDRIGARWRLHGPVTMIAAPDVVSRTIDATDFVGWLLGRVDDSFVRGEAELQARLAAIDTVRDPDGRHRVSEFCCADNTWRATIVELMVRADVVLMDLRGITAERKGCEFELQQLALRVAPARVVLVVEPGADRHALETALGHAAAGVVWFEMKRATPAANRALFERLLDAAADQAGRKPSIDR